MCAQREMIARAALDVLLEKGVYETSLRDICKAAGISIGALYTHFATKEEAVVAACALDHEERKDAPPAETWADYLVQFTEGEVRARFEGRARKRFRVSLQFVAELTQHDRNPEGLSAIYQIYRGHLAASLAMLKANGVIAMPLGLEQTTELHMQLFAGANYQVAADRDLDPGPVIAATRVGLAMTAGLIDVCGPAA